ncbi:SDR family oxidoreductase [Kaistia geumhonensis]|uniref:3-oxoacyl-[acyl-carrier protein] reductase n=1 Tax=Kaistia geumhonensis TaxID=410839 RepID=A0ABU0M5S9_9HYPH|nr:SDR family oxidoreductase [Kaistia geumhonensis]MCX5478634.1 SDR family oxidoreductase [Kaistia geumhonensis]MDQ0516148.1 3-oxoacyl-[acyl-carrier protein] reductase [Kaistia geumhonensis]
MTGFSGKTVLVTGGASGIGRGIVEAFIEQGARVAFTYASSGAQAAEIVAAHGEAKALALQTDATDENAVAEAVARTNAAFGRIDIAVGNAGGLLKRSKVAECSLQLWNEALAVNLTSAFLLARAVVPQMTEAKSGAIVLMSSLAAHDGGGAGASHYAASKGGVMTFVRALAKEVGPDGVRVNGVAPGLIGTQFHDRFSTAEGRKATVERTPMRREGTPADVAAAVLYLASPAAGFIAGEIIEINGGLGAF